MKAEIFKSYIGKTHEIQMSDALGIPINSSAKKGIDLIDSYKGVEVKGCLIHFENDNYRKKYVKWTLFDSQLHWREKYDSLDLYCALGTYGLSVSRKNLGFDDVRRLEFFVSRREFWIVPWDWTLNFPISEGKYHNYRYLRPKPIANSGIPPMPRTYKTFNIKKGRLHLTKGVPRNIFPNL